MQYTDGIHFMIIGPEGIGADKLCQSVCLVCFRAFYPTHFMQDNGHTGIRGLPGGFRSGHAAANDMYRLMGHCWDMRGVAESVKWGLRRRMSPVGEA